MGPKTTITGTSTTVLIIFIILAIIIFVGYYYLLQLNDAQKQSLPIINSFMDPFFWQLTHFFLFLLLGIFFPCSDFVIIWVAILWELIEHNLGLIAPKVPHYVNGKTIQHQWWHGSVGDIVIDLFGYYTGKAIYFSLNQCSVDVDDFFEVGFE